MLNTYIDGGGLAPDQPIGESTRIRFSLSGWGEQDVVAWVEPGKLIIAGIKRPLDIEQQAANIVAVTTKEFT